MSAAAKNIHLLFWSSFLPFFVLPHTRPGNGVFLLVRKLIFHLIGVKAVKFPFSGTFYNTQPIPNTFNPFDEKHPSGTITFTREHRSTKKGNFRSWENRILGVTHKGIIRFASVSHGVVLAFTQRILCGRHTRKLVCRRDEKLLFTTASRARTLLPTYTFSESMRICLFNRWRFHHKTNVNLLARVCTLGLLEEEEKEKKSETERKCGNLFCNFLFRYPLLSWPCSTVSKLARVCCLFEMFWRILFAKVT